MKISSPVFQNNQTISPTLQISNVPENARSLVLIVDDPDAPMSTRN